MSKPSIHESSFGKEQRHGVSEAGKGVPCCSADLKAVSSAPATPVDDEG